MEGAIDASDDVTVRGILATGLAEVLKQCPNLTTESSPRPVTVEMWVVRGFYSGVRNEGVYLKEGTEWKLHSYTNATAEEKSRRKAEEAAQRAMEAQLREEKARGEAQLTEERARRETRVAGARQELGSFLEAYGAKRIVSCSQLSTNPFAFEGQAVAVQLLFGSMLERDKALFAGNECNLVVSGVPYGTFSTEQVDLVLIGRVVGKTEVRLPLGSPSVPHLEFVGAHICRQANCGEFRTE